MLFDSSLRRDLQRSVAATLTVILTIVVTTMLIRTLGQAAAGAVGAQDIVMLLVFAALGFVPLLLSLSLFVATIATLTRMYRDSEMAVWFASGVSLVRFVPPLLRTAWPLIALLALTALVARPWGQAQLAELRERHERQSDLAKIAAGEFQSSRDGSRVFYIDRREPGDPVGTNVFILSRQAGRESVTTAREGRVVFDDARRLLELEAGQRTALDTTTGERASAEFTHARIEVGDKTVAGQGQRQPRALGSWTLLWMPAPEAQAELAWRVGLVFSGLNMVLLGLGLSTGGARQHSNWTLLIGLLVFVVYYNLMNLSQAWASAGRLNPWAALVVLHAAALVLAWVLIGWRQRGSRRLRLSWRRS